MRVSKGVGDEAHSVGVRICAKHTGSGRRVGWTHFLYHLSNLGTQRIWIQVQLAEWKKEMQYGCWHKIKRITNRERIRRTTRKITPFISKVTLCCNFILKSFRLHQLFCKQLKPPTIPKHRVSLCGLAVTVIKRRSCNVHEISGLAWQSSSAGRSSGIARQAVSVWVCVCVRETKDGILVE